MPSRLSNPFRVHMDDSPERGALRMSCVNAHCQDYERGFLVILDPADRLTPARVRQIEDSGNRYLTMRAAEMVGALERLGDKLDIVNLARAKEIVAELAAEMLVFVFPRHQPCFKPHVDRDVTFTHGRYVHTPLSFNESYNESAYRFERAVQRG